jgi:hypothetical protein
MKILILSNWSSKIAEINDLTEGNKIAYAELHGYDFSNVKWPYTPVGHVEWLKLLQDEIAKYDAVMTIGCDAIFVNQSIKIESRLKRTDLADENGVVVAGWIDQKVVLAKDLTCCWPIQINNDVMIWPAGQHSTSLIDRLIRDADIWWKYPQLWQCHLWNLIQREYKDSVRLIDPRLINATFQPMTRHMTKNEDGSMSSRLTRIPGASSYALGDWIFHALDMPIGDKLEVLKWALQYVGDGSWKPIHSIAGAQTMMEQTI